MIITILDATVDKEKWDELRTKFKKLTENIPPQMVQTLLIQNSQEQKGWKVITIWKSKEEFMDYRKSMSIPIPEGITLFRSVGAEPVPSLFTVSEYSGKNV